MYANINGLLSLCVKNRYKSSQKWNNQFFTLWGPRPAFNFSTFSGNTKAKIKPELKSANIASRTVPPVVISMRPWDGIQSLEQRLSYILCSVSSTTLIPQFEGGKYEKDQIGTRTDYRLQRNSYYFHMSYCYTGSACLSSWNHAWPGLRTFSMPSDSFEY